MLPNTQTINIYIGNFVIEHTLHQGLGIEWDCSFCAPGTVGSFIHVVWECPGILDFWGKVVNTLTGVNGVILPMDSVVHLLNDDSRLSLTDKARIIWLACLTAAKKIVVQHWKPPHNISIIHWLRSFLDISYLELSSARINDAGPNTILMWTDLISDLKDLLLD